MIAIDLLRMCEQSGVTVELVDGGNIALEPIELLPDGLLNQIKKHKTDLVCHLSSRQLVIAQPVANDAPTAINLSPKQQRALNGFYYLFEIQCSNLRSKDHSIHSAMVKTSEWRDAVQRVLSIDRYEMQRIEAVLIKENHIEYASSLKNWLIKGCGIPLPDTASHLNDDCLHDGTARGFYHWFNTGETIH